MARIPRAMIGLAFVAAVGAAVWWFVRGAPPAEVASEPSGPGGPGDRGTAPERPDVTPPKTFTFASACRTLDPALARGPDEERLVLACLEGLTVIDPAFKPMRPTGTGKTIYLMAGMVLFLGLGTALAIGLALIDDRIYRRGDIDPLGIPVLATIPPVAKARAKAPKKGKAA